MVFIGSCFFFLNWLVPFHRVCFLLGLFFFVFSFSTSLFSSSDLRSSFLAVFCFYRIFFSFSTGLFLLKKKKYHSIGLLLVVRFFLLGGLLFFIGCVLSFLNYLFFFIGFAFFFLSSFSLSSGISQLVFSFLSELRSSQLVFLFFLLS